MNEPGLVGEIGQRLSGRVFISYATADRKQALKVCDALERRGVECWISARDVAPGENYQEEIVRALRAARAMVLVFSGAANDSDEIKKELSLASRYRTPVMALRLQDVEPTDAFAYELSTRQWIDAFSGWDKAIDSLASRIGQISSAKPGSVPATTHARRTDFISRRSIWMAAIAGLLVLVMAAGAWWWLRPAAAAAHSLTVRLAGFQLLSADLPATMRDAVNAEIAAAFNADGVVGVSTASAPGPGATPAYALGGTIRRDGDSVRVITRLTNERSGATLWSDDYKYDGNEVSKVPRHIAVDAGNVVRCGLFGASTYQKPLPDPVLRDYLQFCQWHWDPNLRDGRKALVPARRVVAAVPDFSWGWAGVAGAYWKVALSAGDRRLTEEARENGRQAADRAIAIDSKNSEALWIKSLLIDRQDWLGREDLLKRAVAARRLDCGCEHHQYGWMLVNVGRITDAVEQLRQADDMLALYVFTPLSLAEALVAAGKPEEAKAHFEAAIDLAPNARFAQSIAVSEAVATGDIKALSDPKLPVSAEWRAAVLQGHRAVAGANAGAKAQAVRTLLALPEDQQDQAVAMLLADLGADHDAFTVARRSVVTGSAGPALFWYPRMRGVLSDQGFPAVAKELGLMSYWKRSRTKPDACSDKAPPPFCRMI